MPSAIMGGSSAPRSVTAYPSAAVSIPDSAWTSIALNTEDHDDAGVHDNVTNNTRFTVPAGVTRVTFSGQITFAANATGVRYARLLKNGATALANQTRVAIGGGETTDVQINAVTLSVTGGDYFELQGFQTSGGALNASGGASLLTSFSASCR